MMWYPIIRRQVKSVIDFYFRLRQSMVETMQTSLKQIRLVLGFGVQEFGDLVGLTRQTINNLESKKNKMSVVQYVAVCAIIDHCVKDKPELLSVISTILCSNEEESDHHLFAMIENGSLLKKWFLCFPDESKILGSLQNESEFMERDDFCYIAESCRIFLDQSVLCEEGFAAALQPLRSAMKHNDNRFIVPLGVIKSMQYDMLSEEIAKSEKGRRGMNLLSHMQSEYLAEIRGEKNDGSVMATFISVFAKFKAVNRLALITNDAGLAGQIMMLNNDTLGGFRILVLKYEHQIGIRRWREDEISDAQTDASYETNRDNGSLIGWNRID